MTQDDPPGLALPDEGFAVRVFTLADYAEANPQTGKLYIVGGGIANIWTTPVPGTLAPLYLAFRVRVPWSSTNRAFSVRVRVLNEDRTAVGPDPLFSRDNIELGRPAGYRPGDELAFNGALNLTGLPIERYGSLYFHLEVDDDTIAVHPLKIDPMRAAPSGLHP